MPTPGQRGSRRSAGNAFPPPSRERTTVVVVDVDGTAISVNPDFERTAGYSRYEILGKPVLALQESGPDPYFFGLIADAVRSGRAGSDIFPCRRGGGSTDDEAAEVHPVCDALGHTAGYAAVKRPLPAHSRVAGASGSRPPMESAARMAAGIGHGYNDLLSSIIGFGEVLLLRMVRDDPKRRDVEEILKASERAAFMTRKLLAFGGGQVLLPREVDINALVEAMCGGLKGLIGPAVVLTARLEPGIGAVFADPGQLERVLVNLAVNAREAMPGGGTLAIETANVALAESFVRQDVRVPRGEYVRIAVTDTGVGMDEETKARAFEPFFTTKGPRAGLGLSEVYGIVKQSGGYIWASSKPENGTTVTIYLPRREDTDDAPRPSREQRGGLRQAEPDGLRAQETKFPDSP